CQRSASCVMEVGRQHTGRELFKERTKDTLNVGGRAHAYRVADGNLSDLHFNKGERHLLDPCLRDISLIGTTKCRADISTHPYSVLFCHCYDGLEIVQRFLDAAVDVGPGEAL